MKSFLKNLYFTNRLYYIAIVIFVLFIIGHYVEFLFLIGKISITVFSAIFIVDFLMLYNSSINKIKAKRIVPQKLSNGDDNEIKLSIKNNYSFPVNYKIIDEIPFQFQKRDFEIKGKLSAKDEVNLNYILRPVKRGEYSFGKLNIFIVAKIGLISRRFTFNNKHIVPVYPSFIQMRKYELLAVSNRLTDVGIKKLRRISTNREFEQIKDYVQGDDYRTVNWKATARKSKLMVNQYQDEKSQSVYSIIDIGRTMKMPFNEMSLLDYAINTTLTISNIAILKHDKAGLITFSKNIDSIIPAQRKNSQMKSIMEVLYKQKTIFPESNIEIIHNTIKRKIKQRSLLILYTNFEGFPSLERQMPYFKSISKKHLLLVVFFENTELKKITDKEAKNVEEIYIKTIAQKLAYDKKLIVKELKNNGVHSIITKPEDLTVNTINKYLEFKAKGLI